MNIHLYDTLVFLHVMLAIIWLGGGISIQLFILHMMKSDPSEMGKFALHVEWMGKTILGPASGLLMIIGLVMVAWGPPEWTAPFVIIGIVGWLITFVIAMGVLTPTSKKLGEAMQAKGPTDPEVGALRKRVMLFSRLVIVILIVVLWAMIYKPGGIGG